MGLKDIWEAIKAEAHYQWTGYLPNERPYRERFNPAIEPNELQPRTWHNGGYTWNPETREWVQDE